MPVRNILSTLLVSACLIFASCSPTTDQTLSPDAARPTVQEASSKAAVAMPDRYAAQVSKDILRAGGNAVHAAIAANFALAVTACYGRRIHNFGGQNTTWVGGPRKFPSVSRQAFERATTPPV